MSRRLPSSWPKLDARLTTQIVEKLDPEKAG